MATGLVDTAMWVTWIEGGARRGWSDWVLVRVGLGRMTGWAKRLVSTGVWNALADASSGDDA